MTSGMRCDCGKGEKGFTMLEALIALLVLAMGVLAAVAVILNAERASSSSYLRQMANQYAYDMVDRMRANSAEVSAGAYDMASGAAASTFQSNCVSTVCTASGTAAFDKYQWLTDLQNNLPGGTGSIYQPASGTSTERVVQVWWTDGTQASGSTQQTEIVRTIM
ncbi:type IV pilus modification protein PilV [Chromobacterium sp. IIBBL 290-4]|uniref:type IV pilus modification protein PilV n=1 Tax=Chromobacterium sp. IIBBL 290-4 TaxID=2953890 RepID=UPI0020B6ED98|nr:type IV pilus modification protein PilV [Chromobacterium sp. IIBBL 290-4]UTH76164.1 type IV pilus modification protein PilV [Chromobacterium sp. IIBBL 290-4]